MKRQSRLLQNRPITRRIADLYNTYKDVLSVILVILAFLATVVHNFFDGYEAARGIEEPIIPGWRHLESYINFLGVYLGLTLLALASFIAWPTRTNRFTKSVMGAFTLIFLFQMIIGASTGAAELWYLRILTGLLVIGLFLFVIILGRVMFLRFDNTDHRLLIRTLRKNKELESLIYKISHDAFMAEVSRAKGWLELIKLKRDEIHDPELLKYLEGLESTFTNMRKKTNSLMNIDPDKFKDFVDTDSRPDKLK